MSNEPALSRSDKARNLTASLELSVKAVDRCRELLVIADADADDLAEYDAARQGLRFTLEDWLSADPERRRRGRTAKGPKP